MGKRKTKTKSKTFTPANVTKLALIGVVVAGGCSAYTNYLNSKGQNLDVVAASSSKPSLPPTQGGGSQGQKKKASGDVCLGMAQAVYDTGLRGKPLVRLIATGLAENETCNRGAKLRNGPTPGCPNGSTDRYLFQFNDCYHPEVKCSDAKCDAKNAKRISKNGTDFHEWATTTNGRQAAAMGRAAKLVAEVQS